MAIRSMTVTDTADATTKCCQRPSKFKTKVIIGTIVVLIVIAALCGFIITNTHKSLPTLTPDDPVDPLPPSPSKLHKFKKMAVCTDAPLCSEIGNNILLRNGSAVDAAIAAMVCNGFLNMQSMGLGGGFFMTVYIRSEEKAYTVNAREKAPFAATEGMFDHNASLAEKGPLAVGVPGELRGLWAAHKRWGRLPWQDLMAPALNFCKNGFEMSKVMYDGLQAAPYIKTDAVLKEMYVDEDTGDFYLPGSIIQPSRAICRTFGIISEKGGDELYNGSLAREFASDLRRIGSLITAEDLRNYQANITETIDIRLDGVGRLHVPPPPSSGPVLAEILNILHGYQFGPRDINGTEAKILTHQRIIEAFKFAYAMRTKLGDPNFVDVNEIVKNVTRLEYGEEIRSKINDTMTNNNATYYGPAEYQPKDAGTAHISIMSADGDAVSVTSSVNYYYGAGFATLNTGIVMNNVMDDFSNPGFVNQFGLRPFPANFIRPGKRPLSSMAPSIISDTVGNAKVVIGASGGTKITSAIALATMRMLWFKQTVKEAVDEARIHHQLFPMKVEYEFGIIKGIVTALKEKNHTMDRYRGRGSIVCALFRNKTDIWANADFRKGGDVSGN